MTGKLAVIVLTAALLWPSAGAVQAAEVVDLYAAQVPQGEEGLDGALRQALSQVLVRVTGRRDLLADGNLESLLDDARSWLVQYRYTEDGEVWASFDEQAVNGALQQLGAPIWGRERPTVLIWLAVDDGAGQRFIVSADPEADLQSPAPQATLPPGVVAGADAAAAGDGSGPAGAQSPSPLPPQSGDESDSPPAAQETTSAAAPAAAAAKSDIDGATATDAADVAETGAGAAAPGVTTAAGIRDELAQAAKRRGLPVIWPLMDLEDMRSVMVADICGGFQQPVLDGSKRYSPDVVLVGCARRSFGSFTVRWQLLGAAGSESWRSDFAEGIDRAVDRLSQAYAATGARGSDRLVVSGVNSLRDYARAVSYLEGLSVVDAVNVVEVQGDELTVSLATRANWDTLLRAVALDDVMAPEGAGEAAAGGPQRLKLLP